jgi:hypothetical protein
MTPLTSTSELGQASCSGGSAQRAQGSLEEREHFAGGRAIVARISSADFAEHSVGAAL